MVLAVIRHAESIENADKYNGFYQDRRPWDGRAAHAISRNIVGLTPRGFRQSAWLGRELAELTGMGRLRVLTSTCRRSIDTADVAFTAWPGQCERTPLLDEQHYGDATYPDGADGRRQRKHLWVPPGGGESLAGGVMDRARRFVDLAQAAVCGGQTVVAVTHHTTILALRCLLEDRPLTDVVDGARRAKTPNAGIYRYQLADGRFEPIGSAAPPLDLGRSTKGRARRWGVCCSSTGRSTTAASRSPAVRARPPAYGWRPR
ncbi:histidine phosphatase family protein [Streptomyces sp. NPDC021218]|uniref:histidine phosphatase family protein n=1 Tax=Streptomyces sp. NPDC021218 TaxID=3365119 RepID=UPI0037972C37